MAWEGGGGLDGPRVGAEQWRKIYPGQPAGGGSSRPTRGSILPVEQGMPSNPELLCAALKGCGICNQASGDRGHQDGQGIEGKTEVGWRVGE